MQRCVCVSMCYQHSKLTFMMCTQSQADRKILVHELAYYIMDQLKKVIRTLFVCLILGALGFL